MRCPRFKCINPAFGITGGFTTAMLILSVILLTVAQFTPWLVFREGAYLTNEPIYSYVKQFGWTSGTCEADIYPTSPIYYTLDKFCGTNTTDSFPWRESECVSEPSNCYWQWVHVDLACALTAISTAFMVITLALQIRYKCKFHKQDSAPIRGSVSLGAEENATGRNHERALTSDGPSQRYQSIEDPFMNMADGNAMYGADAIDESILGTVGGVPKGAVHLMSVLVAFSCVFIFTAIIVYGIHSPVLWQALRKAEVLGYETLTKTVRRVWGSTYGMPSYSEEKYPYVRQQTVSPPGLFCAVFALLCMVPSLLLIAFNATPRYGLPRSSGLNFAAQPASSGVSSPPDLTIVISTTPQTTQSDLKPNQSG